MLRCCEAASLSALAFLETWSAISAGVGEESSGSNTVTVSLLLDLHTHVEHDVLCVGRSNPTIHCPHVLNTFLVLVKYDRNQIHGDLIESPTNFHPCNTHTHIHTCVRTHSHTYTQDWKSHF